MKFLFSSLFGRISAIFLVLLLALSLAQLVVSVQSARKFSHESDQSLNRNLARNLARRFQPALTDGLDMDAVAGLLKDMMIFNPRVESYLLDAQGGIVAYSKGGRSLETKRVNLEPILRFLDTKRKLVLPLYGQDPRHRSKSRPFSAAPVRIGGRPGYLYLILGGEQYQSIASMVETSYIIQNSFISLGATFIVIGLAGLLVFFLLTKRLRAMMGVVRAFEAGDHAQRVRDDSQDEIGQLARAFNEMAGQVEATLERLQASDAMRRELIANVSHDLRSPLTSAQGYLETLLMKEHQLPAAEKREFLEIIHANITRLGKLVSELFELSKLEAGQVRPSFEAFSISELAQDVIVKFQPQARDGGISLSSHGPRNLPFVRADIGLIERVLVNLIDNALRHTPPEGRVDVEITIREDDAGESGTVGNGNVGSGTVGSGTVENGTVENGTVGSGVRVRVVDSGRGIPPEALPYVFERFYRADKSRSRGSGGGSGLGLAIVKSILELHRSDIEVTSTPNVGTVFTFDLPLQFDPPRKDSGSRAS